MSERHAALTSLPPILPRLIRRFAVVIVLLWLGFTAFVNLAVPQLEVVGKAHSVSMSPSDAASIQAIKRVGQVFGEFDSDNAVTIVLEGDQPLGGDAHRFYSDLMRKLSADTRHVAHIQDFWGDPLTAAGSQSADDRAAYVVVYLVGNNETEAYDSVHAVRHMVDTTPPPHGVKAYVTGPAALNADQAEAGDKSIAKVTAITSMVIAAMLLVIYRSVITAVLVLIMVGIASAQSADSSPCSPTTTFSAFQHLRPTCSFSWRLRRARTTRYSCSAVTTNRATPARIGKRPSTRCFTGPPT